MWLSLLLFVSLFEPSSVSAAPGKRPDIVIGPKQPYRPLPVSPARTKVCNVQTHGDGTDDAPYILQAIGKCNNGGHVVFARDRKYIIGTALNLTFLEHIDLGRRAGSVSPL